jgi:DNA-binding XRE family transcriptional regulator
MNELKELRMAAGLTQCELSTATGIRYREIVNVELGCSTDKWGEEMKTIKQLCHDRIKMFKRDAGLTIKLG